MSLSEVKTSVKVLIDTREKHWGQNPYISLLVESVEPATTVRGFSWAGAILGDYDVLHVHWPEFLLRQPSRLLTFFARLLFGLMMLRVWMTHKPVVRTMHNWKPHIEQSSVDQFLLGRLDAVVAARIWLEDREDEGPKRATVDVVIPHSDYEIWATRLGVQNVEPPRTGNILCFGVLRPYKRFEDVITAVNSHGSARASVIGAAADANYVSNLEALAEVSGGQISILPKRLSDRELAQAIQAADLIAVPYEDLYNSGVILMALTLQRPVLLRNGMAAENLQNEYGAYWVRLFHEPLDEIQIESALADRRMDHRAQSERRSWAGAGKLHSDLYSRVNARRALGRQ